MRAALVAAAIAVGLLVAACSQPVDFERMRQQKRLNSFGESRFFSDDLAMRVPPAGTVAVGSGLDSATDVPFPVSTDVVGRGRHDFEIHCAVCHGAEADGTSVMATNMPDKPPPSLVAGEALDLTTEEIFDIASHGKNRMPAYDWSLPSADRWAIVAYLRTLQGGAK